MKKRIVAIITLIACTTLFLIGSVFTVNAADFDSSAALRIYMNTKFKDIASEAYCVMEYETGQVLAEKNADKPISISSLAKMMTVYIAYKQIDEGKLAADATVITKKQAANTKGITAFLYEGEKFPLNSGIKAVIINSCNDVTVAIAEHIGGTEERFVELMNETAKELGMNNTNFTDSTGIKDDCVSSAKDYAILSKVIIDKFPQYLDISSTWIDTFRNGTFNLYNNNKLLKFMPGIDGLKISSNNAGQFCAASTYVSDNRRMIAVVLGSEDENVMVGETRRLFEYCYANYKYTQIEEKGTEVKEIKVKKAKSLKDNYNMVKTILNDDLFAIIHREDKSRIEKNIELPEILEAPVKKGDVVGSVTYTLDGKEIGKIDVVADNDVERANWFQLIIQWILEWFGLA